MVGAVLTGIAVGAAGVIPWAGTAGAVGLAGQLSSTARALIWETGPDFAFARSVITFMLFAGAAAWAYGELARTARSAPTRAS